MSFYLTRNSIQNPHRLEGDVFLLFPLRDDKKKTSAEGAYMVRFQFLTKHQV